MIKQSMDAVYTTRFLNLLRTDFRKWNAFKLGLISEKGLLLRKPRTDSEKKSYTKFHSLVRNIKTQIERVGGKHASTALVAKLLLSEATVAGEHGYDASDISSGKPSGSIVNKGPMTFKKFNRKRRNKDDKQREIKSGNQ